MERTLEPKNIASGRGKDFYRVCMRVRRIAVVQVMFAILKEKKKAHADREREWVPFGGSGAPRVSQSACGGLGNLVTEIRLTYGIVMGWVEGRLLKMVASGDVSEKTHEGSG